MIKIHQSKTADTRSCAFAEVSKEQLLASSQQHIGDVVLALNFFIGLLVRAAGKHDYDKLTAIDAFHKCFVGGFVDTTWWDAHRKMHRHHLAAEDGIPEDVNLLDLLEYIADCTVAGKARTGAVFPITVTPELLQRAFANTCALLDKAVVVMPPTENTADVNGRENASWDA